MCEVLIMKYVFRILSDWGGVGVKFALKVVITKQFGVPESTYYRALKNLIDAGLLVRIGRDTYIVGSDITAIGR